MNNPLIKFNPGDLLLDIRSAPLRSDPNLYVVIAVHPWRASARYHLYRLGDGYYFNVSVQWTHTYCVLAGK
jgi:hypothetical protein